jgi:outer membrane lipoprotein-sorting protein
MLLLVCTWALAGPLQYDPKAEALLDRFASQWAATKTLTYRFVKTERMRDGKVIVEEARVKLRTPNTVYIGALKPHAGQEVIYDPKRDRRKLVVHPGTFPDVTVRLDIYGGTATKGQHHPVSHSGFDYTLRTIRSSVKAAKASPADERLEYRGPGKVNGRAVEIIALHAGTRGPRKAMAKDDESLFAFAERQGADPYLILVANPEIDALDDDLEEREYVVPAYYGKTTELKLDAELGLPLEQTIWDAAGNVYERYEFFEMVMNPPLTDADFDPENPAYKF